MKLGGVTKYTLTNEVFSTLPDDERIANFQEAFDLLDQAAEKEDNDPDGALQLLGEALEKNDNLQTLFVRRGYLYLQRREFRLAAEDFKRAIELAPFNPENHYHLACAHAVRSEHLASPQQAQKARQEAYVCLESAIERGYTDVNHMITDTDLRSIQGESEFEQLVKRLK